MLPCFHVTMFLCYHVTMLPCYHVSMFLCFYVSMFPCYHVSMLLCFYVSMFPCYHVSMLPCHHVSMLPCTLVSLRMFRLICLQIRAVINVRSQPGGKLIYKDYTWCMALKFIDSWVYRIITVSISHPCCPLIDLHMPILGNIVTPRTSTI